MIGLRIFSATGAALTADEIAASHRVAAQNKNASAGVVSQVDPATGVMVEYYPVKAIAIASGTGTYPEIGFLGGLPFVEPDGNAAIEELQSMIFTADRWSSAIKGLWPRSSRVFRSSRMTASYTDVVVSDVTDESGVRTRVKRRDVALEYVFAGERKATSFSGSIREQIIDSTRAIYTMTDWHMPPSIDDADVFQYAFDLSMFSAAGVHQYESDVHSYFGMGVLWNGTAYSNGYGGGATPAPDVSTSIHPFVKQYHNEVGLSYRKTGPIPELQQEWSSSMTDAVQITIIPFEFLVGGVPQGFVNGGVFGDIDAVRVFGSAICAYDFPTGDISLRKWVPVRDASGAVVDEKTIEISVADPGFNTVVLFGNIRWPDVVASGKLRTDDIGRGSSARFINPGVAALMKAVIDGIKPA